MISNPVLQWLLSAVFLGLAGYAVLKTVRSRTATDRVSYAAHVLMGAAMFAMAWPWGMDLLLVPQIVVFSLSALWFALLSRTRPGYDASPASSHHRGRGILAYHAGMTAAMALMAAGMTQMGAAGGGSASGAHHAMGSMPGMDMSGSAAGAGSLGFPLWVGIASALCAVAFGIAALYFTGSTLASATSAERASRAGLSRTLDAVWNLLMAAGMAALFLPMASLG